MIKPGKKYFLQGGIKMASSKRKMRQWARRAEKITYGKVRKAYILGLICGFFAGYFVGAFC